MMEKKDSSVWRRIRRLDLNRNDQIRSINMELLQETIKKYNISNPKIREEKIHSTERDEIHY